MKVTTVVSTAVRPMRRRHGRLLALEQVRERLVSVAGLVGRPVALADGREVGRIVDVVVRRGTEQYPAVAGLVVRVGRRKAWVHAEVLGSLESTGARMNSARLDVRDFEPRPDEVALVRDVLDHQLVDVDGIQVVRANDLYLARVVDTERLVGVEVGGRSLLRRLAPSWMRRAPVPERLIDWGAIRSFESGGVQLDRARGDLERLRPADVAHLLEELGRAQRQELLAALGDHLAADALEEMEEDERDQLLRETTPERTAAIVAAMEPDEAVETLREIPADQRSTVLRHLPAPVRERLAPLLDLDPDVAGGMMTSTLVRARASESVREVIGRLATLSDHRDDIDGVLVVDERGVLVDDISLFELLMADGDAPVESLVGEPWPVTVAIDASIDEVVDAVLGNRRSSVVVVDDEGRPEGRILTDDVLDHLVTSPRAARRVGRPT